MVYLDILIGFSLVMVLFASAVSVSQTVLKKILAIKGKALHGPLLEELEHAWRSNPTLVAAGDKTWNDLRAQLSDSLRSTGDAIGGALRTVSVSDASGILRLLQSEGLSQLDARLHAEYVKALAKVETRWNDISARLMTSYETHTRRWVLGLSLVAVTIFNVDAIRLIQVLSVSNDVRTKLAAVATVDNLDEKLKAETTLTGWQRFNSAELAGTGVPIGWSKAPLYVCTNHQAKVWGDKPCTVDNQLTDGPFTVAMWLARLLGLLIAAGLIAQGAPFWYSILDTVVGLKKKADKPSSSEEPLLSGLIPLVASVADGGAKDKAAAGGAPGGPGGAPGS